MLDEIRSTILAEIVDFQGGANFDPNTFFNLVEAEVFAYITGTDEERQIFLSVDGVEWEKEDVLTNIGLWLRLMRNNMLGDIVTFSDFMRAMNEMRGNHIITPGTEIGEVFRRLMLVDALARLDIEENSLRPAELRERDEMAENIEPGEIIDNGEPEDPGQRARYWGRIAERLLFGRNRIFHDDGTDHLEELDNIIDELPEMQNDNGETVTDSSETRSDSEEEQQNETPANNEQTQTENDNQNGSTFNESPQTIAENLDRPPRPRMSRRLAAGYRRARENNNRRRNNREQRRQNNQEPRTAAIFRPARAGNGIIGMFIEFITTDNIESISEETFIDETYQKTNELKEPKVLTLWEYLNQLQAEEDEKHAEMLANDEEDNHDEEEDENEEPNDDETPANNEEEEEQNEEENHENGETPADNEQKQQNEKEHLPKISLDKTLEDCKECPICCGENFEKYYMCANCGYKYCAECYKEIFMRKNPRCPCCSRTVADGLTVVIMRNA